MSNSKAKEAMVNKALHHFNVDGWNCAESVYMANLKKGFKPPLLFQILSLSKVQPIYRGSSLHRATESKELKNNNTYQIYVVYKT